MKSTKPKVPRPPADLGDAGRRYWRKVLAEFVVEDHHHDLLVAACRQLDRATQAREIVAQEGIVAMDRFGQAKCHPAVEVERSAHLAFLRLQREMALDVDIPEVRAPRRPGTGR